MHTTIRNDTSSLKNNADYEKADTLLCAGVRCRDPKYPHEVSRLRETFRFMARHLYPRQRLGLHPTIHLRDSNACGSRYAGTYPLPRIPSACALLRVRWRGIIGFGESSKAVNAAETYLAVSLRARGTERRRARQETPRPEVELGRPQRSQELTECSVFGHPTEATAPDPQKG